MCYKLYVVVRAYTTVVRAPPRPAAAISAAAAAVSPRRSVESRSLRPSYWMTSRALRSISGLISDVRRAGVLGAGCDAVPFRRSVIIAVSLPFSITSSSSSSILSLACWSCRLLDRSMPCSSTTHTYTSLLASLLAWASTGMGKRGHLPYNAVVHQYTVVTANAHMTLFMHYFHNNNYVKN